MLFRKKPLYHYDESISHTPQAIRARLKTGPQQYYLRDWVYGGIDGAVTTFAIVCGVTGAHLSTKTVLIMGAANLIADGISMAASNFLGTQAEIEQIQAIDAIERQEIALLPEGEKEEVRQILLAKGLKGDTLEHAVEMITSDKEAWVQLMLRDEHGLPSVTRSPWKAGMSTFWAFLICGSAPLLPYLVIPEAAFTPSILLTGFVFFLIGALKSKWSVIPWWRSGLTTLAVGLLAAITAYLIGHLLEPNL